ncbi:hypothetical protein GRX03_04010 [Halovenus sp. WSH3]|uniref:Uncharacterized protein n=1 Tax=Halovenus carboxidivorans TaxID=2692199 RepID=A0A6B0T6C4_9EURY|nr:hypothetical protein [Halovenus carboxidivorans]MXR50771.1 hypothetical protein [Halovenus carboxidivorans]
MSGVLAAASPGRAELAFGVGVALLLVSGLLPWIVASEPIPVSDPAEEAAGLTAFGEETTSEEILGIDRVDWVVLAGVGLVATGLIVTEPWDPLVLAFAGASGVAALGLGVAYVTDPVWMYSDWIKPDVAAVASTGPGVYLAVGSGLLQCLGCYLGHTETGRSGGAQQLDGPQSTGSAGGEPTRPSAGRPQNQPDRRQRQRRDERPRQDAGRRRPREREQSGQQPDGPQHRERHSPEDQSTAAPEEASQGSAAEHGRRGQQKTTTESGNETANETE